MAYSQQVIFFAFLGLHIAAASTAVSYRVHKHDTISKKSLKAKQLEKEIVCPAPIFVAECGDDGTCFCVCKDEKECPSTALVLEPEQAAKLAQEAFQWVENGAPYSLMQVSGKEIKCPAPIFVAECKDDGTCFCVCKDKETCPSTAIILDPAEAAKLCNEAVQWVKNGAPYSLAQKTNGKDITCPAPIFVAECKDDGTCFCVCKDKETCPSTALVLEPEQAAKMAQEAFQWVENGAPYSLAQFGSKEIKCPAPIFVAECKDDGTCFCVCKDKETCPSTAIILDPVEAAKLANEAIQWVKNGAPYSLAQAKVSAKAKVNAKDITCPAPIFVAECKDDGTCFCVCKDKESCPSTALVLDPEEAAKMAKEAFQWVENGAPYSMMQISGQDIKCPAPIFVAECKDDGTCFCVCKDKKSCPSTAIILDPVEAAKLANEAIQWVKNGAPYSLVQVKGKDIQCPAPIFVAECKDDGTCFCVCKDKESCPSTALVLEPAEAAKMAQEAFQWVENGAPYSLAQFGSKEIKCPAPIFVAECKEDGTCFCVCKDKETCPSTAIILDPEEAAKLCNEAVQWVKNGAPYSLAQAHKSSFLQLTQ